MLCSRCHKPFDVSVTQTPDGRFETYAQCFTCLYSIKLHRFEPDRKKVTIF